MDELDLAVRRATYALFVERGRAPAPLEVGDRVGSGADTVTAAWRRLHDAHALVLNAAATDLRMLNPFSAVPTAHRVHAAGRWWYANCAWDAFGIGAALHVDVRIETSCPDCGDAITLGVREEVPDDPGLLFHCAVPASQWWADIVFT